MNYLFRPSAQKQFDKLDTQTQSQIVRKLDYFLTAPNPLTFAKRLTNMELGRYRFRIGDYRIVFDVIEETITVLAVGHRSEIYK